MNTENTPKPRIRNKKAASPRMPGRPTRAAAASMDVRPQLLDAAIACFVRQGIHATSLRAISAEAGVTPALLHYYFGDKQQLQHAVVAERVLPAMAMLRARLDLADDDPAALVAAFVRGIGDVVVTHPWLPALWMREVLNEGGALRDVMMTQVGPRLPVMLAARFALAQQAGRLNPDLDPRLMVVSLVGLTLFPYAAAPIWRELFNAHAVDAMALGNHTVALLDRGMGIG